MDKFVADLLRIVVDRWKSDVTFVVEPNVERVKICNQYPLPDVELSFENNQRILYVFLSDP